MLPPLGPINMATIIIFIPWCHYISDEWFASWYHRRENEHLYHFNESSLIEFFKECGYECLYTGCFEDVIRKNPAVGPHNNILSDIFKKIRQKYNLLNYIS